MLASPTKRKFEERPDGDEVTRARRLRMPLIHDAVVSHVLGGFVFFSVLFTAVFLANVRPNGERMDPELPSCGSGGQR